MRPKPRTMAQPTAELGAERLSDALADDEPDDRREDEPGDEPREDVQAAHRISDRPALLVVVWGPLPSPGRGPDSIR